MKKLLIALLIATPMVASAGHGDNRHHERHLQQMEQRLDLSAEQKKAIQEIFTEHRKEMGALRERTQQRVDAILNPTQRAQMADLREERKEEWKENKSRHQDKKGSKKEKHKEHRSER
jgi:Spy/CpxP family protein refolding chaperone